MGSFDVGEYVYFFFRETAVEYINCGKAVYSRVARVCKKDTGGKNILSQNWVTYLKARLNCSISGEFPFYFNEIQSVYQIPSDKTKFYATFTTSTNGLVGSAVCSFDIEEIQAAFNGKFQKIKHRILTSIYIMLILRFWPYFQNENIVIKINLKFNIPEISTANEFLN